MQKISIFIIFFFFLAFSCYAKNKTDEHITIETKQTEESRGNLLYREAMMLYSYGEYKDAVQKLELIEQNIPNYSKIKKVLTTEAFLLYLAEKYPECVSIIDSYNELYKNTEYSSYMYFLKANAIKNRPKSPTKEYYLISNNIDAWKDVINIDKQFVYSEQANTEIQKLQEVLCLHDLKIGDTELDMANYFAAIRRYQLALHCNSDRYKIEASKRLVVCYKAIRLIDQAEKYQSIVDNAPSNYQIPEELTFKTYVKNFFYDMIPHIEFLPNWTKITT